jgi:hypothetical protein
MEPMFIIYIYTYYIQIREIVVWLYKAIFSIVGIVSDGNKEKVASREQICLAETAHFSKFVIAI